jgi:protein-S-isoprenylcysteine O-methyltransferase Ste14
MTTVSASQRTVWLDLATRVTTGLGLSYFVWRILHEDVFGRLPLFLLLIADSLSVILVLTSRRTETVDRSGNARFLTFLGTFYFVLVSLSPGRVLVPLWVGECIQITGISLQIAAKLTLGRSFGLLPANRGLVVRGPYRLVRHPMYFGYFLNHMGFLATTFSTRNLVLYMVLYWIQIGRLFQEERLLTKDEAYRAYANRVRFRFLPFLF